ncbi:MAG: Calx-beta domain-containing protein [Hormoscilla sp.]
MDDIIYGTSGNDAITGTGENDIIVARAGNDLVFPFQGDDLVIASAGNDSIDGGDGDDIIRAGPGNDQLDGESGNDLLDGDQNRDTLTGGPGRDIFVLSSGEDIITDFTKGEDLLGLSDNLTFNQLQISGVNAGDTIIRRNGQVLARLENVNPWEIDRNDFTTNLTPISTPTPPPSNPGTLAFSQATYNVSENGVSATITVRRSGGSDGAVSANYSTFNGTARAGSDYLSASGLVNFADGETSKTFTISIRDDNAVEGNETVNLRLSNPRGRAGLGTQNTATLTIVDAQPISSGISMGPPTSQQQEMLELLNRMRMNPAGELNRLVNSGDADVNRALNFFNVDVNLLASQWSNLTSAAPLAWSPELQNAARGHGQQIIAWDQQSHQLPGEPDLGQRIANAGYNNVSGYAENIFAFSESVFYGHAGLAIDWDDSVTGIQNPPSHRNIMMSRNYREVGIDVRPENNPNTSVGPLVVVQNFGSRFNFGNPWLLGVAFADADFDNFYDSGEGLGNVNVNISGSNGSFSTRTMTAGGYQVQVPPGNYTVTFSGDGLDGVITEFVNVGFDNTKLDLIV